MQNRLSQVQFRAIRQLLPDEVSDGAIQSRTLVITQTSELLYLSADGKQLVKCAMPKLPIKPKAQNAQAYQQALADAGYRAVFVISTTKSRTGAISNKCRCQLFIGKDKTPLYEACEPEPMDGIKYSVDGLRLAILQNVFNWITYKPS